MQCIKAKLLKRFSRTLPRGENIAGGEGPTHLPRRHSFCPSNHGDKLFLERGIYAAASSIANHSLMRVHRKSLLDAG